MWNGNTETLAGSFLARDALVPYALRMHFNLRRRYPEELAAFPVARLRTQAQIDELVATIARSARATSSAAAP